jgi:hypothetical protein
MSIRGYIQGLSSIEPVFVKIFEVVKGWVTVDVWVRVTRLVTGKRENDETAYYISKCEWQPRSTSCQRHSYKYTARGVVYKYTLPSAASWA